MYRIDERTVELTDFEETVCQQFNDLLAQGLGIIEAVDCIKHQYGNQLSREFYEYLKR